MQSVVDKQGQSWYVWLCAVHRKLRVALANQNRELEGLLHCPALITHRRLGGVSESVSSAQWTIGRHNP